MTDIFTPPNTSDIGELRKYLLRVSKQLTQALDEIDHRQKTIEKKTDGSGPDDGSLSVLRCWRLEAEDGANLGGNLTAGGFTEAPDYKLRGCVGSVGADGAWSWRRWSDGWAECWQRRSVSAKINLPWTTGNPTCYCNRDFDGNKMIAYPFAFIAPPAVSVTVSGEGGAYVTMGEYADHAHTPKIWLTSPSAISTARTYYVYVHAVGRWK